MTLRTKIELGIAVAILGFAGLGVNTYLNEHDALKDANAAAKILKQQISDTDKLITEQQAADAQRDALRDQQVQALQSAAAKQVTPQQIAQWLPKQLGGSKPITITVPAGTPQNPTPDATATIPQQDLPALRNEVENCQECAVKLKTAQDDLTSKDTQLKESGDKLSAANKEIDAYKQASQGGTFWHRFKHEAKEITITAAVAVGIGFAAGKSSK